MALKKFKTAFVAHVPDAEPARDRCTLKTSTYELTSVLVKDDSQAVEVCRELAEKEGVKSYVLCPGFTHASIARIAEAVGECGSISVARGDPPGNQAAHGMMGEAGWFKKVAARP